MLFDPRMENREIELVKRRSPCCGGWVYLLAVPGGVYDAECPVCGMLYEIHIEEVKKD